MATVVEKNKKYTYEDYVNTSDDRRHELIEGELIMAPSPTTRHQRVLREIEFILKRFVSENNLGEIFFAPYDIYIEYQASTIENHNQSC